MEIICIVCIVCIVFIKSFGKILTTKDKNHSNQGFTGHNVPSAWGEDNHRGSTARSWKVSENKQNKTKTKKSKNYNNKDNHWGPAARSWKVSLMEIKVQRKGNTCSFFFSWNVIKEYENLYRLKIYLIPVKNKIAKTPILEIIITHCPLLKAGK